MPASSPIPSTHPLYPLLSHALHAITCGGGPLRHARHDALARLIAHIAHREIGAEVSTTRRLSSSSTSGTKVDVSITSFDLEPPSTSIDATVSCPLLPTYVRAAASSASAIFTARSREKERRHLAGCVDANRSYLTFVFTTLLSLGPANAREFIDSLFSIPYARELIAGGTGYRTTRRRLDLYLSLQATIVKSCTGMVMRYTARPTASST